MPASYPTSVKVFTTKSDGAGNTILASHPNDLQAEVTAIETDLLTAFTGGGADGGQLKFPATQNPSADANTLDDYEEGTYTPTWTSAGTPPAIGDGIITGRYIKAGKLVNVWVSVSMGTTTTYGGSDPWTISLPFTSASVVATIGHANLFEAPGGGPRTGLSYVGAGASTVSFFETTAGVASSNWCATVPITWQVSDVLLFHIAYEASA